MAKRDEAGTPANGPSGEQRSMTERMLDLIRRFDAAERRGDRVRTARSGASTTPR
jgi:hypothetical protein